MAQFDTADLLARCKVLAQRPSTDQQQTDANWYQMLSEAQDKWFGQFALHCPWVIMTAPTLLTSTDSNETYTFGTDTDSVNLVPLSVVVYAKKDGRPLRPGTYWDSAADYVWEGDKIRFARGKTKAFSDGPYARFITPPDDIAALVEPTLKPKRARVLLVYHAVALWATRGGIRDPQPFFDLEERAWVGRPEIGDYGLLGQLKMQNPFQGVEAFGAQGMGILEGVDDGSSYSPEG